MQFHRLMQYHILSRAKLKCDFFFLCTLQGALSMCPIGIMALIFPISFNFFEKIDLERPKPKRFYYRRPRDSYYTMKTKLEPVHSTISWYTWAK